MTGLLAQARTMAQSMGKKGGNSNKFRAIAARNRSLKDEWETLCTRYLPITPKNSIWRYNRVARPDDPEQGWKIHISATIVSANKVLARVSPLLSRSGVLFKAPSSLRELKRLNCGLFYGFEQVGKIITVYPKSDRQAVSLARKLHKLTSRLTGPTIPYDFPLRKNSRVHYRYGVFRPQRTTRSKGKRVHAIRSPEGKLLPDLRDARANVPSWTSDPFREQRLQPKRKASVEGPLGTTILAYEVMSRRGKGGVYRALDLSVRPARMCVLKEGKPQGETDVDGRDGYWRATHEAKVLSSLRSAGVEVPEVYCTFEVQSHYYLVAEFIDGQTLQSVLLNQRTRLPVREALMSGLQLARLLKRIHDAGWVWRDCKPMNLILSKEGILRPFDFEGACPVEKPDVRGWGTEGYIPPEWLNEPSGISRIAQDLFALGATLHQLLSGRLPDRTEPPPIGRLRRHVPLLVRRTISALLGSDPLSRPDAAAVVQVLESACSEINQ